MAIKEIRRIQNSVNHERKGVVTQQEPSAVFSVDAGGGVVSMSYDFKLAELFKDVEVNRHWRRTCANLLEGIFYALAVPRAPKVTVNTWIESAGEDFGRSFKDLISSFYTVTDDMKEGALCQLLEVMGEKKDVVLKNQAVKSPQRHIHQKSKKQKRR